MTDTSINIDQKEIYSLFQFDFLNNKQLGKITQQARV